MMNTNRLSNGEIAHFCKSLSLLLHAGIGVGDGLYFMAEEETGADSQMFKEMGQNVDQGDALWQALEKNEKFPFYVTGMVKVGEYTGHLEEALMALSQYYEERERRDRQMRNVLTYPTILLLLMLLVIGVLLVCVLPVFDEVYASLGGGLTGVAGWLLHLGQLLKSLLPVLGIFLAAAAVLVLLYFYHAGFRKKAVTWFMRRWGDRGVFKKLNDAHFMQALEMGYRSGLNLEEAAAMALGLLEDVPEAAARYQKCVDLLSKGETLAQTLKEAEILPVRECRLLELGMRSGSGEMTLGDIAARLSEEAAYDLERNVSRIEPAMVLTASLMVGVILLAVMLPLMNIMSAIG